MIRWLATPSLIVAGLLALPGCHVLVRLGEPPSPREEAEKQASESEEPSTDQARPEPRDESPTPDGDSEPQMPPISLPENLTGEIHELAREQTRGETNRPKRLDSNTGINTDTALAPGEGQYIYRTQLRFLESHSSPSPADIDVNVLVNPHILVYGVREDLSLFGVVPLVLREGTVRPPAPPGAFSDLDEQGVADLQFLAKYRFWKKDLPGETYRWSLLGGIEVPTFDKDFSSDSWDPFIGTVWTYQSQDWGLDLDLVWKFNTGQGEFRNDELTYDAAYTYVLLNGQTLSEKFWQLNSVFELNGTYTTDGSHLLFAAPGFQLALERMIVEASLQLPVIRDLKTGVEPDFLFAIGTRITW